MSDDVEHLVKQMREGKRREQIEQFGYPIVDELADALEADDLRESARKMLSGNRLTPASFFGPVTNN